VSEAQLQSVFLMWHVREDDEYMDDAKLIGAYRSRTDCEAAITRLKHQPGFRDYVAGFQISEYVLNKDHWTEGFISSEEAQESLENGLNSD
jgi:hypothetical protein